MLCILVAQINDNLVAATILLHIFKKSNCCLLRQQIYNYRVTEAAASCDDAMLGYEICRTFRSGHSVKFWNL